MTFEIFEEKYEGEKIKNKIEDKKWKKKIKFNLINNFKCIFKLILFIMKKIKMDLNLINNFKYIRNYDFFSY